MKQVKFAAILLVAFVSGLLVGDWKPGIAGRLKVRLGVKARTVDYEGPYYQSKLAFFQQTAGVADAVMLGDSHIERIEGRIRPFPLCQTEDRTLLGHFAHMLGRVDKIIDA